MERREDEIKRCIESPAYFYNTYVKITDKDGNEIPKRHCTDEEMRNAVNAYRKYKMTRR